MSYNRPISKYLSILNPREIQAKWQDRGLLQLNVYVRSLIKTEFNGKTDYVYSSLKHTNNRLRTGLERLNTMAFPKTWGKHKRGGYTSPLLRNNSDLIIQWNLWDTFRYMFYHPSMTKKFSKHLITPRYNFITINFRTPELEKNFKPF